MIKSPAFQWYAADYLADERVMVMSLEAEGAYVRLLSYCWREGSIPANPALLSAMCKGADVKLFKVVLACFTKQGAPPGRLIHKRLEEERAKQEAFKARQADNGKLGGRPKKGMGKPDETQTKGLGFFGETQTEPKKRSISSTSSSITSDDVSASPPPLSAELQARLAEMPDTSGELPAIESLLNKPDYFRRICEDLGLVDIDFEHYRRVGLVAAKSAGTRTIAGWESWVSKFFTNQKETAQRNGGALLLAGGPVLLPNQIPSNAAYVAPPSMGIPDSSSYLKPIAPPSGQYTGQVQ